MMHLYCMVFIPAINHAEGGVPQSRGECHGVPLRLGLPCTKLKILLVAPLARVTGPKPVGWTIRPDCRIRLYPPVSIPDGPHLDPPTDPEWRHPVSVAPPVYLEVIRYAHAHWILPPVINGCAEKPGSWLRLSESTTSPRQSRDLHSWAVQTVLPSTTPPRSVIN